MSWQNIIRSVWKTIPYSERRSLRKFTLLQSSLSSLDLITVLLLGSSATIAYRTIANDYKPSRIEIFISDFFNIEPNSTQLLLVLSSTALVLLLLKNIMGMFFSYKFLSILAKLELKLSSNAFTNFLNSKPKVINDLTPSDFQWIISTAPNRIIAGFILPINNLIADVISTFFLITFAFIVSPITTMSIVIFSGIFLSLYNKLIGFRTTKYGYIAKNESIILNNLTNAVYSGFKEVKIYGITEKLEGQFKQRRRRVADVSQKVQWINSLFKHMSEILILLIGTLIMSIEIIRTDLRHSITILVIFLAIGFRLIPISQRLQATFNSLRISVGMIESYLKFNTLLKSDFKNLPFVDNNSKKELISKSAGIEVQFENVSLKYSDNLILKDISFDIAPGECILIVGESGVGKTSLIDLITGISNPTSGKVLLRQNGKVIDIEKTIFCGYAIQSPLIVEGTVRNNIEFFYEENNSMKVIDLLDKFNLSKLEKNQNRIESDNFVEKNNDFSGGEKIRIGVARALLSKRPLLIFDEPTNSLDLENRQQVIEAIKEIYETTNTTLIIVAHNPDEFNFANKILRIKNASVHFETK